MELVGDGGTVDVSTTGTKTKAVSIPVRAGTVHWLVAVPQGGATTVATLRCAQTSATPYIPTADPNLAMTNQLSGLQLSGITGALPASLVAPGPSVAPHKVLAKAG